MKKSAQVIGLPVIAITDGKEVGKVIDFVINPKEGLVEYLIVETGVRYLGLKALNTKSVESLGEDALTIEKETSLTDMKDIPQLFELLQKDITLNGTKVLTKKGKIVGSVREFYIDEEEMGKISGFELAPLNNPEEVQIINASDIVTYGKDAILIKEESDQAANSLSQSPSNNSEGTIQSLQDKKTTEEPVEEPADESVEEPEAEAVKSEEEKVSFEKRQRAFLLGRKVSKNILSNTGELIVEEGTEITEEIINKITAAGKFAELIMNNNG